MNEIINKIRSIGGTPILVGGCVRDRLLGIEPKDIDIEVYGISFSQLASIGGDTVGKSFGILKVGEFDLSIPRRENKIGVGHCGFDVEIDPFMSPKEAASRRDFTINSLGMTPEGEILDFFGGVEDLNNKVLRATSEKFMEDPLRVLRGMQFCGRFNLKSEPQTLKMCQLMKSEFETLSKDRIWHEWHKLFKSPNPSAGLDFLKESGWLKLFPQIDLVGIPQDPIWHPEGDVWTHTLLVCDEAARIAREKNLDSTLLVCGALLHDVGKAITTVQKNGRWVSPKHASCGVPIAQKFLESIKAPNFMEDVLILVKEHMSHLNLNEKNFKKLLVRLENVNPELWGGIVEADHSGRHPLPKGNPAEHWVELSKKVSVKPVVLGRHLIERGIIPGPQMGELLKQAFELQMDGLEFEEILNNIL